MSDLIVVRPTALANALEHSLEVKMPPFIWGAPGLGKSAVVHQLAAKRGIPLIDLRAVLMDPVDLRGLPHVTRDGTAKWAIPDFLPKEGEGILFLDELLQASAMVQSACFQLVLDRKLGEYNLPDGWHIVAASNEEKDRAGTHRMLTPLRSRFMHLVMAVHNEDWNNWALDSNIRSEVIAFLRFRPALLHDFKPDSAERTFPCPRTWSFISKVMDSSPSADIEDAMYAGCIGQGAAAEFKAFLKTFRSLPDIDGILMNPAKAPVPKNDPAVMYALTTALARRATETNFKEICIYTARLPQEFGVYLVASAIRRDAQIMNSRAFTEWAVKNQGALS